MKVNMDSVVWLPLPFRMELECGNVERLNDSPREILSNEARKPTRNSNHIWCRLRDSNPGHTGWKRVLSLLRGSPCFRWSVVRRGDGFLRGVWGLCRLVLCAVYQSVWFVSPYITYQTYEMLVVTFRSSCELNLGTVVIDMFPVVFQSKICRTQAWKIRRKRFSRVEIHEVLVTNDNVHYFLMGRLRGKIG